MTVGTSSATMQTTYPATIKGIQDVEIRPKISGFITKVCVHEGETVGAGQLLFVIDNETYQAAVREAQAAVGQARASINTA
ncbi:MAG TPA: efflux RND transporter periplasmic adaptor subunit, partial [Prevotella sp.]|nr:efflux RND transporter periplasmic adaptor subunit [Prevotella sp.]